MSDPILFLGINFWYLAILAAIWTLPWKGFALWKSARLGQKWWFIILLLVNTIGILEILYIFIFSKKKTVFTPAPNNLP